MAIATDLTKKIRFAEIRTDHAIYNRAEIMGEGETTLTVQYYRVDEKHRRIPRRDVIAKRDIIRIRYYTD